MEAGIKKQVNANFTLEAVVIILVFFITLAFLYLNFFLHDKNLFIANLNEIVQSYKEVREEGLLETSYISQKLRKGLWMSELLEVSVGIKGNFLEIKAVLGQTVSDEKVLNLFPPMGFSYTIEKTEWLFSRSESARIFTVGIDTLAQIKGVHKIIEDFLGKQRSVQ